MMTDDALRIHIYDRLVAFGRAPSAREIGAHFDITTEDAHERLAALRIGKTAVINPQTREIWMAGPFAAGESAYRLSDGKNTWWANCAWDMFGVANIVGRPMMAETHCPDCGERIAIECHPDHPPVECQAVVHFLVPAKRWYDDIGFT
jgi:hypothetical protein